MNNNFKFKLSINNYIQFIAFLFLLGVIIFLNRDPFYDEILYLENINTIKKYGISKLYLLKMTGSAGPLYSIIHYYIHPITVHSNILLRFVNVILFSIALYFSYRSIKLHNPFFFNSFTVFLIPFSIPMVFPIVGMALTEVPAMFFLSISIFFLFKFQRNDKNLVNNLLGNNYVFILMSGFSLSFSIIGRQPYLLLIIPFCYMILFNEVKKKDFFNYLILFLVSSLLLPVYCFIVWKGLVPPFDASIYKSIASQKGISLVPKYVFLCLFYMFFIHLIIGFRQKLNFRFIKYGVFIYLILFYIEFNTGFIDFVPLKTVLDKFLFDGILKRYISVGFSSVIFFIGFLYLLYLIYNLKFFKSNFLYTFCCISILLIAFSCIKITHQFSSRYAAQAIPFYLLMYNSEFCARSTKQSLILLLGTFLGLISMFSYFLG